MTDRRRRRDARVLAPEVAEGLRRACQALGFASICELAGYAWRCLPLDVDDPEQRDGLTAIAQHLEELAWGARRALEGDYTTEEDHDNDND